MDTKKILVIDFDQEFLKFLSQFLHNEGFSVITAADGFAGLEKYKAERPDLVITEAMLPKLHGFELCSRITNNQGWKTPVIIVTGVYKDTIYKTEALRTFGASSYFEKPLDTNDLMTAIRKILGLTVKPPKKEEVIDEAIMEAIFPGAKKETSSNGHPPEESPEPEKKEKPETKSGGGDEIDNMLESTLAGLGMATEKKKAAPAKVQAPAVKPVRPARVIPPPPVPTPKPTPPLPPLRVERTEFKPEPKPAKIKKEEPRVEPPKIHVESHPNLEAKVNGASFSEFMEPQKKSASTKIIGGAVAGCLVLVGVIFLVMKPGKSKSVQETVTPPPAVTANAEAKPAETPAPTPKIETTSEVKRPVPEPATRSANQKVAAQRPAETAPSPFNNVKPIESETRPQLEMKIAETPPAQGDANAASSQTSSPAPNPGVSRDQPTPTESPATEAPTLPVMAVKTGDLLSLKDVDVQPQTIKSENPVYPPIAMGLRVEGTVTVNALISETGNVIQTTIIKGIKGPYGFDAAAETAVKKWKFQPAQKNGIQVRVWKPINVTFKLKR